MRWSEIETWPNHDISRRIAGPVHRWHVQETGQGPLLLLLHGAGGSTHSWRDVIPLLATDHRVVAIDLPGHGFTQLGGRQRSGLQTMADDIAALAAQEGWTPKAMIGHSAGGAVALELAHQLLSPRGQPPLIIGINAALGTFPGLAGLLFPALAKMLSVMPFSAALFSGTSSKPERVANLIASTGSQLVPAGTELYRRLVADRDHVDGTLQMMAQWDLKPLLEVLPDIPNPTMLIAAENDKTVPPAVSEDSALRMKAANCTMVDGLGHLAHEEDPSRIAALIRNALETLD